MPIEILMPALSPTMEEGTLSKWTVKEGDTVNSGDVIAEIETDKATMEVEAVDEGVIGKILVDEGTEGVKVNAPIGLLLEDGEDKSALEGYEPKGAEGASSGDADAKSSDKTSKSEGEASESKSEPASSSKSEAPAAPSDDDGERIKASPLARRMAKDAGLDLKALDGSGPKGRIVKRDIEEAREQGVGKADDKTAAKSEAPKSQPSKPVDENEPLAQYGISADRYEIKKADNITKISAKRLSESFRDIPHFPLNVDCRLDALLKFRKEINAKTPEGVKVSVNDILIKASGLALKKVPQANASWIEDGRIAMHKHADVSVAVAIEGGLITPIIKDADQKGLAQISTEMKDLATRARDRKLKPEEYQGGTFSLSNLGMFGISSFSSIINPPQGMILSVGAGEERPVITDGALAKATVMTVTLTCDHRVVDGANGARWLSAFKGFIEDPMTMLM
ncbi:MAG: pyruvate dehydrogenase complex dihydrolipoamide acetyltransferase [Oceanicaulis sp.]|uniref:pyruvate dehydrogenase complex dihydrolipoamide acetyltransferase n=1 Tax=unclassified Oceanicaulis TaxID=2632123 RepID=UPI000C46AE25|nr:MULTISPECIES: pyruvate dehydrogenase complex dihydrolipoamide acetyltransferase [unclassified Oceanicaulis]MAB69308.1 pyruvate dehydrogenase complex dihydrolipoamide acetyltransferase [Oceanicaulis sp.]MBC39618.1 pyruvate dehydrogenase complex dihydrolipoamide acetyltransferase [Oceanicaulis sp.]MBG35652.1 pyruvate dehydrogenase complex dihydrolipoamide acetyltransferase [Oceanicaulis sp.]HBU62517.1 pyruvate dehydrogenase complex dihydrolipoamide acetyltransferase [Oceanicaulis sp.]